MPESTPRTISVSGTGRVSVEPDIADLRLGVSVTAKTVEQARAASAASMTRVLDSMVALGVAKRDTQTSNLSLSPVYDYAADANPPRLTGYTLTNTVAVTLRDLASVGATIDEALEAGATSFDGISFRVDDPSAAEEQARAAAVADARARADSLATAAGLSLGAIAAISESGAAAPVGFGREMAMMAGRDAVTPIETGSNEIAITVVVTYLIG